MIFILALCSVTPFSVDKAASKLNWTQTELKWSTESENPQPTIFYLWECVRGQVGIGWLGVAWFTHIPTHTHTCTQTTHTHTVSPLLPGPRCCLAPCRAARLLHWVPGWPVLFPCSNAPFVFVLLFWEWKKGAIQWGEWWIGGRERERGRQREI